MLAPTTHRVRHPLALRLQCRKEWVEGQGTLAEIARKHGVPLHTLTAWYRRENWSEARERWYEKQLSDNQAATQPSLCAQNHDGIQFFKIGGPPAFTMVLEEITLRSGTRPRHVE